MTQAAVSHFAPTPAGQAALPRNSALKAEGARTLGGLLLATLLSILLSAAEQPID